MKQCHWRCLLPLLLWMRLTTVWYFFMSSIIWIDEISYMTAVNSQAIQQWQASFHMKSTTTRGLMTVPDIVSASIVSDTFWSSAASFWSNHISVVRQQRLAVPLTTAKNLPKTVLEPGRVAPPHPEVEQTYGGALWVKCHAAGGYEKLNPSSQGAKQFRTVEIHKWQQH